MPFYEFSCLLIWQAFLQGLNAVTMSHCRKTANWATAELFRSCSPYLRFDGVLVLFYRV